MTEPTWRLVLLGRIDLVGGDQAAAARVLVQPKHLALVAWLTMVSRGAPSTYRRRDEIATLLWPELDQGHARASLRRVVHQVRTALGANVLISRGDEDLAIGAHLVTSDVAEFTAALAAGQLAAALESWNGELMPGFHLGGAAEFQRQLDAWRTELREDAGGAAWALAQRLEQDQHLSLAAQWARKVPKFAPDNERVLRRALTMLDRLGDRAGALSVYEEFARRLHADFEAHPSAETRALVDRIRS